MSASVHSGQFALILIFKYYTKAWLLLISEGFFFSPPAPPPLCSQVLYSTDPSPCLGWKARSFEIESEGLFLGVPDHPDIWHHDQPEAPGLWGRGETHWERGDWGHLGCVQYSGAALPAHTSQDPLPLQPSRHLQGETPSDPAPGPSTASLEVFSPPQSKPQSAGASHTPQITPSWNATSSIISGGTLFPPFIPLATPLSQVFQGMLRANKDFHDTKSSITRLWIHECFRWGCCAPPDPGLPKPKPLLSHPNLLLPSPGPLSSIPDLTPAPSQQSLFWSTGWRLRHGSLREHPKWQTWLLLWPDIS